MERTIFSPDHLLFRESVRRFVVKEIVPNLEHWTLNGIVSRDIWNKAGENGLLAMAVPEQFGGVGQGDFLYNVIVNEEIARTGRVGPAFSLHNDIVQPYFLRLCNDEQKKRWFPGLVSGELITAIALTEPNAGSDLAAMRTTATDEGDHFLLNGTKTFITNGILNDLVIVAALTNRKAGKNSGFSLFVVERGMDGYNRGKKLAKIGQRLHDTSELFFNNVQVPKRNLLGKYNFGFLHLMENLPQERLSIAVRAMAATEQALELTVSYCQQREASGYPIGKFQNSRFILAEMKTKITIGRAFVDRCLQEHVNGTLSGEEAAMAKWWCTELENEVADRCLQLHGGDGCMLEYPIARAFLDARAETIYGGTTEIMKEIIGRSMGF
jgi:alkylation response protein AidB-like acyl-CoA dehydrogenase